MADRHDIAEEIEALAVHCRPPLMSVEDRSRWTADWCEDLKDFPIEAISHACRRWRNGTNPKFPMLGQLIPLIKAADPKGAKGQKVEAWRPLSDDEYRDLPLKAKIRHHQILAHEARKTGGPMWTGGQFGKPIAAADMPPKWHDAQRRGKAHDAEAKRLRAMLKPDPNVIARQSGNS